jgi:hypothetical protein
LLRHLYIEKTGSGFLLFEMSGDDMKTILGIMVLTILFGASSAWPGEIFGSVRQGNSAVRAQVSVKCDGNSYGPVNTDNFGSYRLFVRERGQCTLTVDYQGQALTMGITSYERPMRYDVEVRGDSLLRR